MGAAGQKIATFGRNFDRPPSHLAKRRSLSSRHGAARTSARSTGLKPVRASPMDESIEPGRLLDRRGAVKRAAQLLA